jgi:drug/metabolite transporter (DMT)-like permease
MGGVVAIARPSLHASDQRQLLAYGLLLLAAGAWATSIVYVRAHRFGASPLALAPWQALVAATALLVAACLSEGAAAPALTTNAVVSLSFVGPVATAFAYWAVIDVGRVLRPSTISVALLGTPALGVLFSALTMGETVGPELLGGLVLIGTGIGLATVHGEPRLGRREARFRVRRRVTLSK